MLAAAEAALAAQAERDLETQFVSTFGRKGWFSCRFVPFPYEGESHLLLIINDITERKQAEEEIQTILRTMMDGFYLVDNDGRFLDTNDSYCRMIGYSREELLKMAIKDVEAIETDEVIKKRIQQIKKEGHVLFETKHRRKDGRIIDIEASCNFLGDEKRALFVFMREITERKWAEKALRDSEAFLNTVIEKIPHMIFVKDAKELRFVKFNQAGQELLGYSLKELVGKSDYDFFPKEMADAFMENDRQILRGKEVVDIPEEPVQTRDKGERILHTKKVPVFDNTGQLVYLLGISEDITGRKQAEESQARLATAVEQAAETIVITDTRGKILYANPAFEKTSGYTCAEALGQNPRMLKSGKHDAEFYRRMWQALAHGEIWSGHFINRRKDGVFYEEDATISPVRDAAGTIFNYVAVKHDVTREVQLEAQFRQSQKMEAIGQLASGVAHDFNNILNVIIGYGDLISADLDPGSPLQKYAAEILHAAEHAVGLTRQLLVFSRKQSVQLVALNLNEVVKEMDKMLRRLIGESIELTIVPAEQIGRIKADSGYIGQVLINLAVNARDAMPNGGKLTIATSNVTLDANYTRTHTGVIPGDYVMLTVSDTGTGMTQEVKARMFEALFTTKPSGKGTGLGLATCQTIVQQSGGHIDVDSEVGKGTSFKIYFPQVDKPLAVAAGRGQTGPLPRGTETLLLVEDEASVRHLAWKVLESLGYRVLRANNGQEGLRVARECKGQPVHLVITDVIMPQMNGKVMAEWLKTTYPEIKVLFTSGYTDDAISQHGVLEPGVAFLPKPYTTATLARKVRAMLDNETDTAYLRKNSGTIKEIPPASA
jgi:PAS domain S-box-containing protein